MYTFLLILVTIIWGSTFFIIKDTIESTDVFLLVFGRTIIAAFALIIFLFIKNKKQLIDKKAIGNGAILGVLLAITYCSQAIGLKYTTSGHSAFITGTAVIIVPILLILFFKQKIRYIQAIAIIIVFVGLFLLSYNIETKVNIGDVITIITAISYAAHIVFSGRFVKTTSVFSLIAYQFLFASIISFILLLSTNVSFIIPNIKSAGAIIYLGLIGTLFCYFISVWIQQYVNSIKVALTFSLEPIFAAFFGFIMLGELLNLQEIIGGTLILSGVIFYNLRKKISKRECSY